MVIKVFSFAWLWHFFLVFYFHKWDIYEIFIQLFYTLKSKKKMCKQVLGNFGCRDQLVKKINK